MLSDNSFVETNKLANIERNSFVGTNELPTIQFKIDANFPIAAFMNIGFTHHYAIISKVKDVAQRKFYIRIMERRTPRATHRKRQYNIKKAY